MADSSAMQVACIGWSGYPDQNGFLSISCGYLMFMHAHDNLLPACSFGDEGDDLCHDPHGTLGFWGRVFI